MAGVNERLKEAAKTGSTVELKALLRDPGCNPLLMDDIGMTALMCAAHSGHEECVGLLLPVSDMLDKDSCGLTALMHAVRKGNEDCTRILLPKIDTLTKDAEGGGRVNVGRIPWS